MKTKSKAIAIILALFLGGIGIHKFYLGQAGQGILYLLFCWTFIPEYYGLYSWWARRSWYNWASNAQ